MRRTRRLGLAVLFAAGLAVAGLWQARQALAQAANPPIVPGQPAKPPAEENEPSDGFDALSLPEDRDAKQRYKAVLDYLDRQTNIPWDVVCGTAQQLLDGKSDSFYPLEEKANDGQVKKRYVSIKDQVSRLIGTFPKEGRQFYQLTFGPQADAILKEAVEAGYDKGKLADVAQRFFHTEAGGRAALLLATRHLQAGNYTEAAYGFDRLLARPESDALLTPKTLFKAAVAFKRAGDSAHGPTVDKLWAQLDRKFPRDGLAVGRRTYTLDELRRELDRPADLLFGRVGDDLVAMRYGNPSHTGAGTGGTPFLSPAFKPIRKLAFADDAPRAGRDWVADSIRYALGYLDQGRAKGQVALPGFFPVTAPNLVLYRSYDGVYAVVARDGFVSGGHTYAAGDLFWMTPTEGGIQTVMNDEPHTKQRAAKTDVEGWWKGFWQPRTPTLVFENAQAGSLSHDGKLVYFVDDLAVPPPAQLFNPNMGIFPGQPGGFAGKGQTDHSRLVAVDLDTGKVRWTLGGPLAGDLTDQEEERLTDLSRLTDGALFLGPPVPVNGKLYVFYERKGYLKLACLDPHKLAAPPPAPGAPAAAPREKQPELLWVQNLGRPTTPLTQDSLRRIQPVYPAYADGVLVCPTNCGAVIAVDVTTRSLLWARGYSAGPKPQPVTGGRRIIRRPFDPNAGQTLPQDRWRASAPIVADGKVVVTAHDSDQLQCLDLRTGNLLWADARQKDDLYVGGVVAGNVLVVGKETVRAYPLGGDGKPAWKDLRIGTPCGHGVATKDGLYYVPMIADPDRPDVREPQVWAVDARTGQAKSKTRFRAKDLTPDPADIDDPRLVLGNLAFHEGQLISQSATRVSAFPLIELKKQEMDRLLATNPNDPRGLLTRGELLLDDGKIKAAVADLKESLKHDPPEDVRRAVREKLYLAYTELLRSDFAAAEGLLGEYQALCELPIDTDDEVKKRQLLDEQTRRKGLYLSLVAKGRERQGRLVEAFDHYRAFAALGDSKQLVTVFDEPSGLTRPDVWARGRIDGMIRAAKDPAVRKPLEDRVRAEWDAVREANDLARLREFVKVFGPYFAEGRAAQLLLAEKLLQTNNDDDMRDAQIQLMQLWATADDRPTAARAVDALARVMTRRGMLEDAVGLYAQLGTKYADVEVRDGKTGADIYGELITDKRLLPYLEPTRGPAAGGYKVSEERGNPGRPLVQTFTLQPDGELLPFFARYQLVMEMNPNGGAEPWTLRVTDRVTGEDRCKFPGLSMILGRNGFNTGPPTYRVAQASGHLLLLNIGQFAYCFDLAEKRELWRYNLFGNAPQVPGEQPQVQPPQPNEDPNELVVSYPDGWTLRLGRSAVLQPNLAVLVTRDGLVALDPYTKDKLWQRSNVSTKAQVFGDARHLFLVETSAAGTTAKVLRAVDGSVVEGVKDFSALFTSKARAGVLGRHLLLNEGGTDKPRTVRLYDPLTSQDVWRKEYPQGSLLLSSLDPGQTGCIAPDGGFDVLDARTGERLFRGQLDRDRTAAHLAGATAPLVVADAERVYLFLNRPAGPNQPNPNMFGYTMVRAVPVNGVAYGFDRTTAKRLWWTEKLFEGQAVILDRFADLPALVAAAPAMDEATKTYVYRVVVLDKQLGKLRYEQSHPQNGFFVAVSSDPKTRAVEFWRYDLRVKIAPDATAK